MGTLLLMMPLHRPQLLVKIQNMRPITRDETYDDLFEDEDEEYFQDIEYDPSAGDLTKSYNRQRKLNDQSATAPRNKPSKTGCEYSNKRR